MSTTPPPPSYDQIQPPRASSQPNSYDQQPPSYSSVTNYSHQIPPLGHKVNMTSQHQPQAMPYSQPRFGLPLNQRNNETAIPTNQNRQRSPISVYTRDPQRSLSREQRLQERRKKSAKIIAAVATILFIFSLYKLFKY